MKSSLHRHAVVGSSGNAGERSVGFALVVVLGALVLMGAVAFATVFTATLDTMAARHRQMAVIEREVLEGALALASMDVLSDFASNLGAPGWLRPEYGPWPASGIDAVVSAEDVLVDEAHLVVRLTAVSTNAPTVSRSQRALIQLEPDLRLLRRW